MEEVNIFASALGLKEPWHIKSIRFESGVGGVEELHIEVEHRRGVKFSYEGEACPVYDQQKRTWRHLRFFQHDCYLHADVPRVKTGDGRVRLVDVPWAEAGSSFTLLFEQDVLKLLGGGMSASAAGRHYDMDSRVVFRMMARHVSQALSTQDLQDVRDLSVDEVSRAKGHHYMTIMCDRRAKKVVGVAPGKDKEAFAQALLDAEVRGADRSKVRTTSMDMSRSYISACGEALPQSDIVFDHFHIAKQLNEAVDRIRREEQRQFREELKNSRYLWLYGQEKLNAEQRERLTVLAEAFPNIGEAHRLKELFRAVMAQALNSRSLGPLNAWIKEAWNSGLAPMREFVNMLHDHWYGVKTYFKYLADNAFAERVNLKIQDIKRTAFGYRNVHHFTLMIYFHLGGLNFKTH